jgi:hypothetical protein
LQDPGIDGWIILKRRSGMGHGLDRCSSGCEQVAGGLL